eukprot:604601-Rhodomonas_salina.3
MGSVIAVTTALLEATLSRGGHVPAMLLRKPHAVSGTELAYAASRPRPRGGRGGGEAAGVGGEGRRRRGRAARGSCYARSLLPRAMSGTDLG